MRPSLIILIVATAIGAGPAAAEQHWIGQGTCEKFVVAGQKQKCGGVSIISEADNGRVMAQFPFGDNLLMFSGSPEVVDGLPAINVDNVSIGAPKGQRRAATGRCIIAATPDQHIAACDARDQNGRLYSVQFSGTPK